MSPLHSKSRIPTPRRLRSGMTLVELMVVASVMSLVAVALGGLVRAVDTARVQVSGMHEASFQGRFAIDRIRSAVARTGTYRTESGRTVPGVVVVWNSDRPEMLVLWTGGRESSLAGESPLNGLPTANELIIYSPDPDAPYRLVEIVVPDSDAVVDFEGPNFATQIRQLVLDSTDEQRVVLCDRVRVAAKGSATAAALRFERETTPSDATAAGLRHLLIRIEIQVLTQGTPGNTGSHVSLPVFGAALRRYVNREG